MGSFILSIMIATILAPLLSVGHVQANLEATCPGIPDSAQCLSGRFRAFWEQNGGLPVFGFPISPAQDESDRTSDRTLQTQWFERARFELHTENAAPYDV